MGLFKRKSAQDPPSAIPVPPAGSSHSYARQLLDHFWPKITTVVVHGPGSLAQLSPEITDMLPRPTTIRDTADASGIVELTYPTATMTIVFLEGSSGAACTVAVMKDRPDQDVALMAEFVVKCKGLEPKGWRWDLMHQGLVGGPAAEALGAADVVPLAGVPSFPGQ